MEELINLNTRNKNQRVPVIC